MYKKGSPGTPLYVVRDLLDLWDNQLRLEKVRTMIDGNLVLFFTKDDEHFGCPEESRLVFAKLKNTDEDTDKSWTDEAAFLALNLSKALSGEDEDEEPPKKLFYKKDMDDMKIIDREDLEKILFNKGE